MAEGCQESFVESSVADLCKDCHVLYGGTESSSLPAKIIFTALT